MTPKRQLIEAFRALCEREGGHVAVADEIGANEQNLWQILAGIKLPSGEPRGVGPNLQRRLEQRYPGWANAPSQAPALHKDTLDALARASAEQRRAVEAVMRTMLGLQPLQQTGAPPPVLSRKRVANGN